MSQAKAASLSTILSLDVKRALTAYCKKRGLKISHFIEEAIREHLEDEADISVYEARKLEERVSLEEILKTMK